MPPAGCHGTIRAIVSAPSHPWYDPRRHGLTWRAVLLQGLPPLLLGIVGVVVFVVLGLHIGPLDNDGYRRELLVIALAGLALLGWGRAARDMRLRVWIGLGLTVILVAGFWVQSSRQASHLGEPRQMYVWGLFHYYLGAKYFDELGYTKLYEEAVKADHQNRNRFAELDTIRDLETYKNKSSRRLKSEPRDPAWSDERWEEFTADLDYIVKQRKGDYWWGVLRDRGYNATPAWNLFGQTLTNAISIRNMPGQTFLVLLDVIVMLIAFGVSVHAYGWNRSVLVAAAFYLWFGNPARVMGQMYVLDWFAATWIGVSLWRLQKPKAAGVALGYAAMVRVFPVLLLAGPVIHAAISLIRRRELPRMSRDVLLGAMATMLVLFLASGLRTDHGFGVWKMFAGNIAHHSSSHVYGSRRLGLEHMFTLDIAGGLEREARKKNNKRNLKNNKVIFRGTQVVLCLLVLLAIARADEHDGLLLSSILVFVGVVISRYYGPIFLLLLLLGVGARAPPLRGGRPWQPRTTSQLAIDASLLVLVWAVYADPVKGSEGWAIYVWANTMLLVFFLGVLAVRAFGPPRWTWLAATAGGPPVAAPAPATPELAPKPENEIESEIDDEIDSEIENESESEIDDEIDSENEIENEPEPETEK